MAMKTIICLSFIVLNNFFANVCEKKIVPHQPKASLHVTAYSYFSTVTLQSILINAHCTAATTCILKYTFTAQKNPFTSAVVHP